MPGSNPRREGKQQVRGWRETIKTVDTASEYSDFLKNDTYKTSCIFITSLKS